MSEEKISDATLDAFWDRVGIKPPSRATGIEEGIYAAIQQHNAERLPTVLMDRIACVMAGMMIALAAVVVWKFVNAG